jgi:hypothetical protein
LTLLYHPIVVRKNDLGGAHKKTLEFCCIVILVLSTGITLNQNVNGMAKLRNFDQVYFVVK